MKCLLLFVALIFASEHNTESAEELFEQNANAPILVKIEEDEYAKKAKTSQYIGVSYSESKSTWQTSRWNKSDRKVVYNGTYKDEEAAAHASDTLARKLMAKCGNELKLNFPDDDTEVYPEKKMTTSHYIGVSYDEKNSKWVAQRWSKNDKDMVYNGGYKDEETAAHASDTLARKLMGNREQKHRLNFSDDHTEVYAGDKQSSKYIGVSYRDPKWRAYRRSKKVNKMIFTGYYTDEKTAAHASDTLARKLMANGEQKLKLNFPNDDTEEFAEKDRKNKRKRPNDLGASQEDRNFEKFE